jgi:nucleotide-binding universal stress UspA family protein
MAEGRSKILLAVDGSHQAFEAARYASKLFLPNRIEVVLFHVATRIPESFWDVEKDPSLIFEHAALSDWRDHQKQKIQEIMESARQLFLDRGVQENAVSTKIQQRQVGIARDIIHESQGDYHAVILGRWGMSLLKDFLWGSIAEKIMGSLTHLPVCVVGGTPHVGKIIVGLDASQGAMKAVDYVGTIVDGSELEITLFHAVRDLEEEILPDAEESMESVFQEAFSRLEKAGVSPSQITTRLATKVRSRAGAIIDEALKGGYGTIVVGRRGISYVEEFSMGRVSNKIIHLAKQLAVWVVG